MNLFDTHAHYDDARFDPDRDEVLAALPGAGVSLVVNPGCDLPSSRAAVALAETYPHVFAAVGVHPHEAGSWSDDTGQTLFELAQSARVRAVGEIGLDYYYDNAPRDLQKACFRAQMALARALSLPVIIHDRDAHADSLLILREFPEVTGVFHCFSGSAEMARELVALGYSLSFTGVVTYKNARRVLEAAAAVPLDRLMLETDAPYLAPEGHRGQRNDSRLMGPTCRTLAALRGVTEEELAALTMQNGRKFFQI